MHLETESETLPPYRNLLIWQRSIQLAKLVYKITKMLPKEEQFGLVSQMRRAAVSIPSNIAEGHARNRDKELSRYLQIALGSLAELDTQLYIAKELEYINDQGHEEVQSMIKHVRRLLYGLLRKVNSAQ